MMTATLRPVERAAASAANSRAILEQRIRHAHANGHSLRDIAKAAGISHEQVRRIVKEQ